MRLLGFRRRAMQTPGCGNGTYAAFVSGAQYITAAMCLHRSLRSAGASCPFTLVHDDAQPHAALNQSVLRKLRNGLLGNGLSNATANLLPLTSLFGALGPTASARAYFGAGARKSGAPIGTSAHSMTQYLKLWMWALPYDRVVLMDLDVLPLVNLDPLLQLPSLLAGTESPLWLAAVRTNCKVHSFNSGLLVLRPSATALATLQGALMNDLHAVRSRGKVLTKVRVSLAS